MQINKQLFEDVFSGKLKGTFVLKNGKRFSDNLLTDIYKSTVVLGKTTYYFNGKPIVSDYNGILDIVDFIPDTNMKENELTIEIPNNKVVDWDESKKQNKIVLKNKQLTYEEICNRLPDMIDVPLFDTPSEDGNALVANEHQLECLLAKNKLANVAKYLNDGWKPKPNDDIFLLMQNTDSFLICPVANGSCASHCGSIWFKSKELANQAIEILGEETVKLALEPLGV